jgi:hypothetical protein
LTPRKLGTWGSKQHEQDHARDGDQAAACHGDHAHTLNTVGRTGNIRSFV